MSEAKDDPTNYNKDDKGVEMEGKALPDEQEPSANYQNSLHPGLSGEEIARHRTNVPSIDYLVRSDPSGAAINDPLRETIIAPVQPAFTKHQGINEVDRPFRYVDAKKFIEPPTAVHRQAEYDSSEHAKSSEVMKQEVPDYSSHQPSTSNKSQTSQDILAQNKRHHLLRHCLPEHESGLNALPRFGVSTLQQAIDLTQAMSQRELQAMFERVYGVRSSSNNNNWLRKKLLEALHPKGAPDHILPNERTHTRKRKPEHSSVTNKNDRSKWTSSQFTSDLNHDQYSHNNNDPYSTHRDGPSRPRRRAAAAGVALATAAVLHDPELEALEKEEMRRSTGPYVQRHGTAYASNDGSGNVMLSSRVHTNQPYNVPYYTRPSDPRSGPGWVSSPWDQGGKYDDGQYYHHPVPHRVQESVYPHVLPTPQQAFMQQQQFYQSQQGSGMPGSQSYAPIAFHQSHEYTGRGVPGLPYATAAHQAGGPSAGQQQGNAVHGDVLNGALQNLASLLSNTVQQHGGGGDGGGGQTSSRIVAGQQSHTVDEVLLGKFAEFLQSYQQQKVPRTAAPPAPAAPPALLQEGHAPPMSQLLSLLHGLKPDVAAHNTSNDTKADALPHSTATTTTTTTSNPQDGEQKQSLPGSTYPMDELMMALLNEQQNRNAAKRE